MQSWRQVTGWDKGLKWDAHFWVVLLVLKALALYFGWVARKKTCYSKELPFFWDVPTFHLNSFRTNICMCPCFFQWRILSFLFAVQLILVRQLQLENSLFATSWSLKCKSNAYCGIFEFLLNRWVHFQCQVEKCYLKMRKLKDAIINHCAHSQIETL